MADLILLLIVLALVGLAIHARQPPVEYRLVALEPVELPSLGCGWVVLMGLSVLIGLALVGT